MSKTRPWMFLIALFCGLYPVMGDSSMQDIKVTTLSETSAFFDSQDKTVSKKVRFSPADMDHRMALEKAGKKGLAVPAEFAGAAAGML